MSHLSQKTRKMGHPLLMRVRAESRSTPETMAALYASVVPTSRKRREKWGTLFVFCGRESQDQLQRQRQRTGVSVPHGQRQSSTSMTALRASVCPTLAKNAQGWGTPFFSLDTRGRPARILDGVSLPCRSMQILKVIRRIDNFLLFLVALTISGSAVACEWFPESTFELASESRLPKWITLPPGLARADASITMSYYIKPWGRSVTFILRDAKRQMRTKVDGKVKGLYPLELKHPPPGFPPGYPSYEVITVNGITEIIEHRKMEPIFYITDDPAVWKELGVGQK